MDLPGSTTAIAGRRNRTPSVRLSMKRKRPINRDSFDGGTLMGGNGFWAVFTWRSDVVGHLESDTVLSCKCCAALVFLEQDKDVASLWQYGVCLSRAEGHPAVTDPRFPPTPFPANKRIPNKENSHKGIWRSDAPEASQGQTRDVPGTPGTFGPDFYVCKSILKGQNVPGKDGTYHGTDGTCPRDRRDAHQGVSRQNSLCLLVFFLSPLPFDRKLLHN